METSTTLDFLTKKKKESYGNFMFSTNRAWYDMMQDAERKMNWNCKREMRHLIHLIHLIAEMKMFVHLSLFQRAKGSSSKCRHTIQNFIDMVSMLPSRLTVILWPRQKYIIRWQRLIYDSSNAHSFELDSNKTRRFIGTNNIQHT